MEPERVDAIVLGDLVERYPKKTTNSFRERKFGSLIRGMHEVRATYQQHISMWLAHSNGIDLSIDENIAKLPRALHSYLRLVNMGWQTA